MVHRRETRYWTSRDHNASSITGMLQDLDWESLESRRTKLQLVMLYKIINNLVDIPAAPYLTMAPKRTRAIHSKKLRQFLARTDTLKLSFFPRTIPVWIPLPSSIAKAPDLVHFNRSYLLLHLNMVGASLLVGSEDLGSCVGWAAVPSGG